MNWKIVSKSIAAVLTISISFLSACGPSEKHKSDASEAQQVVVNFFNNLEKGNIDAAYELCAQKQQVIIGLENKTLAPAAKKLKGLGGVKKVTFGETAFADLAHEIVLTVDLETKDGEKFFKINPARLRLEREPRGWRIVNFDDEAEF